MSSADYSVGQRLGEGAYGIVYSVKHIPSDTYYALKKIPMRSNDDGIPQSVLREIASLTALKSIGHHVNVIKIHNAFVAKNGTQTYLNIIFEKCEWDLQRFLTSILSNMPERQCQCFAKQILAGIDFLHVNSIIHRDLKPQNILVTRELCLKIADFGLARNYGLHSTFTSVAVTLNYRSPEILLQCKYNTGADIWSAGCIFVELYTRSPLFVSQSEVGQLRAIFRLLGTPTVEEWPADAVVEHSFFPYEERLPLCGQSPRTSAFAIDLIERMLQFSHHQRPTAAECLQHAYFVQPF